MPHTVVKILPAILTAAPLFGQFDPGQYWGGPTTVTVGQVQTFTATLPPPTDGSYYNQFYLRIASSNPYQGDHTCNTVAAPESNVFFMEADGNYNSDPVPWNTAGPYSGGSNATLENSQCILKVVNSRTWISQDRSATITIQVQFKNPTPLVPHSASACPTNCDYYAPGPPDAFWAGAERYWWINGATPQGHWHGWVPVGPVVPVAANAEWQWITPNRVTTGGTQSFVLQIPHRYWPTPNWDQIDFRITQPIPAANQGVLPSPVRPDLACTVSAFRASPFKFNLENDAGSGFVASDVSAQTPVLLQNSQCILDVGNSSVSQQPNGDVTMNVRIGFKTSFAPGNQERWMWLRGTQSNGYKLNWSTYGWIKPQSSGDTIAPVLSNLSANGITSSGATIIWATNELADTQIEYGLTPQYGSFTTLNPAMIFSPHSQPLTGLQPNTLYYYRARSKDGSLNLGFATGTFTTSPPGGGLSTLTDLTTCLADNTKSDCPMLANTYTVNQTIQIGRSNVTVRGSTGNRLDVKFVRGQALKDPIFSVNAPTPLTGVVLRDLTVCGSGKLDEPHGVSPASCPRPVNPTDCANVVSTATCVDLAVGNVQGANWPTNRFANSGTYGFTMSNVVFEDATGHGVSLYANANANARVNDVFITGSAVNRSAVTGILVGANGADYDRKFCDNYAGFNDAAGLFAPQNIRIENSEFIRNATGAFGINTARWVAVRNNTFDRNYWNPQVGNVEGGTIFFDACTDTVEITGNAMRGPSDYAQTQGMELWGRNITVKDNNVTRHVNTEGVPADINGITGYPNDGIELNSVFNATVTNNNVHDNNTNRFSISYEIGGIQTWTVSPGYCDQVPRDTQGVTVSGNTSINQAYGIGLGDRGSRSRNILNGLNISGNLLTPNSVTTIRRYNDFIVANGPVNPAPLAAFLEPVYTPRALAVDAVSPLTSLCKKPGSAMQTFTFSGADTAGATNIDSIQGYFNTASNTDDPPSVNVLSGPQAAGCHFIYFPGTNVIYLDDANGGNQWGNPPRTSPVGLQYGGVSLSNGYCTIHAGSSESTKFTEGLIAGVTLKIDFNVQGDKYVYSSARNRDGANSRELIPGTTQTTEWPLSGWWATQ